MWTDSGWMRIQVDDFLTATRSALHTSLKNLLGHLFEMFTLLDKYFNFLDILQSAGDLAILGGRQAFAVKRWEQFWFVFERKLPMQT